MRRKREQERKVRRREHGTRERVVRVFEVTCKDSCSAGGSGKLGTSTPRKDTFKIRYALPLPLPSFSRFSSLLLPSYFPPSLPLLLSPLPSPLPSPLLTSSSEHNRIWTPPMITRWTHEAVVKFFEDFAKENQFDPLVPENWYHVPDSQLAHRKVFSPLLPFPLCFSLSSSVLLLPVCI